MQAALHTEEIMTLMLCSTKKVNSNCSSLSSVERLLNMLREMVRSLQDMLSRAQVTGLIGLQQSEANTGQTSLTTSAAIGGMGGRNRIQPTWNCDCSPEYNDT